MYFEFRQNNSGGCFVGPTAIIVEADNAAEANAIAQNHGVYFNGVMAGLDCECCGDRWREVWDAEGESEIVDDGALIVRK